MYKAILSFLSSVTENIILVWLTYTFLLPFAGAICDASTTKTLATDLMKR